MVNGIRLEPVGIIQVLVVFVYPNFSSYSRVVKEGRENLLWCDVAKNIE